MMSKANPMIAIVDDDPSVCRALKRLVRALGMNAETFLSGEEFLKLVVAMPSFQPDCAVVDVQMPITSGLEVQDRLKRCGRKLPIIFITAHDDVATRERALESGAVAYLTKPFNDELFVKMLRAAMRDETV